MEIDGDVPEEALKTHIRALLHDYVQEHLTIDARFYTEDAVAFVSLLICFLIVHILNAEQFISNCLSSVAPNDPSSLTLPVDPMETLRSTLQLGQQQNYDEVWEMQADALQFIKNQIPLAKKPPRTESVWFEDDNGEA